MTGFPQIVVGTYEEFLLGYKLKKEKENSYKFSQTFATHSHQASVRCVAAWGHLMASSGADEYINIYNMIEMKVSTVINYHDATVTCLEFTPDGSHLVTANQNGDIAIFRSRDWTLVKLWKGAHKHANGVTSVSIHPSGSLLITTGADNVIRFWNLVKGRLAYATNFSKNCSPGNSLNFGMWSKTGNFYAVCIGNKLQIYKTETAAIVYEIIAKTKSTCLAFIKKNLVCVGTENGTLEIHCLTEKKLLIQDSSHTTRIKNLVTFLIPVSKNGKNKFENYIVTSDSKGIIKLWHLRKTASACSIKLKGEINCDCRITCLTKVSFENIKEEKDDPQKSMSTEEITIAVTQPEETNKNHNCDNSTPNEKSKKCKIAENEGYMKGFSQSANKKRYADSPKNGKMKTIITSNKIIKKRKKLDSKVSSNNSRTLNKLYKKKKMIGKWDVEDIQLS